jgi:hypothetical protein
MFTIDFIGSNLKAELLIDIEVLVISFWVVIWYNAQVLGLFDAEVLFDFIFNLSPHRVNTQSLDVTLSSVDIHVFTEIESISFYELIFKNDLIP